MPKPEELIAALTRRIQAFEQGDSGAVLDQQALLDAGALMQPYAAGDRGVPFEVLHVVAWLHWCRYQALPEGADRQDLRVALELFTPLAAVHAEAVPEPVRRYLASSGDGADPGRQAQAAVDVIRQAMRTGDPVRLNQAIELLKATLVATRSNPDRAEVLSSLGAMLEIRFKRTGAGADLDEAVRVCRESVEATPTDHPRRAMYLRHLGAALGARFEHTGVSTDLDEAITVSREAVAATPVDHPDRAGSLSNLGAALRMRFARTGAGADLDEAVTVGRDAVVATPADHPDRAGSLSNLGNALLTRFERTGVSADLDEAITVGREAVTTTPADHPDRARHMSNLGAALRTRFERTGAGADLDEAITVGREAMAAAPADHPDCAAMLHNLGVALHTRFERTGAGSDLDEAVRVGREAVAATPGDHPNGAMYLSNLGATLRTRFQRTGVNTDLDEAITVSREAVTATPTDHPGRAGRLSNLGLALRTRFERAGAGADLDEAITVGREAVAATPTDHPDRAGRLSNLGTALHTRFERTGTSRDLYEAVRGWSQAYESTLAPTTTRLDAANAWARATARWRGHAAALEAYAAASSLLPLMAWRGIGQIDQLHLLQAHASSLARDAAAAAIAADRLDLAVELLEQGRGVFWSQLLDTRTDLTTLHQVAPHLARELLDCRAVLDRPTTSEATSDLTPTQAVEARMDAARRFDELVDQVRALPPTELLPHPKAFLKPPPLHTLLPGDGDPIAIVNISQWTCDALMITDQGVTVIKLPDLTERQVIVEANRYLKALHDFERSRQTAHDRLILEMAITAALGWLWDHIAAHILTALGHSSTPTGAWPRLWWCPTGALTVLPLHAAGHHHTSDTVLDRVISSYTPTVRALNNARTRRESTQPAQILIVTVTNTPGQDRLPGASAEQDLLTAEFTSIGHSDLTDTHATRSAILTKLAQHRWLHASCHGTQDLANPAAGGLLPYDWNTAGLVSVIDLTRPEHTGGEFAFLSACKTATGGVTNPDEAVTIAAAMQHAGWRHVIGTLWSIWDDSATVVTRGVYRQLLRDGSFDPTNAAQALHHTIRKLRDADPLHPSTWAPFIHTGP